MTTQENKLNQNKRDLDNLKLKRIFEKRRSDLNKRKMIVNKENNKKLQKKENQISKKGIKRDKLTWQSKIVKEDINPL